MERLNNHFTVRVFEYSMPRVFHSSILPFCWNSTSIPRQIPIVTNSLAKWTVWSDIRRLRCRWMRKGEGMGIGGKKPLLSGISREIWLVSTSGMVLFSFFLNYPRKDGSLYVRGEFFGRFVNAARLSCEFNFGETRHTRCGYCRRQDGRGR